MIGAIHHRDGVPVGTSPFTTSLFGGVYATDY